MNVIIFDIDGTLIRTPGSGRRAFNHAFESLFAVKETWGDLVPHGRTDPSIIDEISQRALGRALADVEREKLEKVYFERLEHEFSNGGGPQILPGVDELLTGLASRGDAILGLQTGNFERSAMMKLRAVSLDRFFRFGGYALDSGARHEIVGRARSGAAKLLARELEGSQCVVIGDTPHDIDAGRHHGCRTIAVATGMHSAEALRAHGADAVFDDFSKPDAVFDFLFS